MRIAIISDIHENVHNLILFYGAIKDKKVEQIICLGDMINAGVVRILAHAPAPVHIVWGNNDGSSVAITQIVSQEKNLSIALETYDRVTYDGRTIFLTHYPMLAKPMAKSGEFDIVFFGHTHEKFQEDVAGCPVVNPGEIAASKTKIASFALYDTRTNHVDIRDIPEALSLRTDIVDAYRKGMGFSY